MFVIYNISNGAIRQFETEAELDKYVLKIEHFKGIKILQASSTPYPQNDEGNYVKYIVESRD